MSLVALVIYDRADAETVDAMTLPAESDNSTRLGDRLFADIEDAAPVMLGGIDSTTEVILSLMALLVCRMYSFELSS